MTEPIRAEQLQLFPTDSFAVETSAPAYERHEMELEFYQSEVERLQDIEKMYKQLIGYIKSEQTKEVTHLMALIREGLKIGEKFETYINHLLATHVLGEGEWEYTFPDGQKWSLGFSL